MGGADKVKRQHDQGRLTVRERIDRLIDKGSFHEVGAVSGVGEYDASGELTHLTPANCVFGRGRVEGRPVVVVGDDFTVRGGSADASISAKPLMAEEMAHDFRLPIIRVIEGSGGGGSVKTIETTGRANLPGGVGGTGLFNYTTLNLATMVPSNTVAGVLTIKNTGTAPVKYTAVSTASNADGKGLGAALVVKVTGDASVTGTSPSATCAGTALAGTATGLGGNLVTTGRLLAGGASESVCVQVTLPVKTAVEPYAAAAPASVFLTVRSADPSKRPAFCGSTGPNTLSVPFDSMLLPKANEFHAVGLTPAGSWFGVSTNSVVVIVAPGANTPLNVVTTLIERTSPGAIVVDHAPAGQVPPVISAVHGLLDAE